MPKPMAAKNWRNRHSSFLIDTVDPSNHRQAKPADTVYLMNNIQCTGILVECGFLSNRDEDLRLQSPGYQKKLTVAIGGSIATWVHEGYGMNEV